MTISFELAKELKEAGYPQWLNVSPKSGRGWFCECGMAVVVEAVHHVYPATGDMEVEEILQCSVCGEDAELFYAPALTELMAACELELAKWDIYELNLAHSTYSGRIVAWADYRNKNDDVGKVVHSDGDHKPMYPGFKSESKDALPQSYEEAAARLWLALQKEGNTDG